MRQDTLMQIFGPHHHQRIDEAAINKLTFLGKFLALENGLFEY